MTSLQYGLVGGEDLFNDDVPIQDDVNQLKNSKKDKNSWLTMAERAPSSADFYTTGDEQLQQFQQSVIIRKTEGNYTKITGLRT